MSCGDVETSVKGLERLFENNRNALEPFINHIRFPHFKGLGPLEQANFEFPVTVFVGANGCNKTSILQALYGAPQGKNVADYWFETEIDKISDGSTPSCFVYGYFHSGADKIVEVLKTRIRKKAKTPEYWEPARPQVRYNMAVPSKSELLKAGNKGTTRWDLIRKNVVYSDCKEYVSAYDLFFYHYNFNAGKKFPTRQEFIRERSRHLAEVINNNLTSRIFWGRERIQNVENLESEVCEIVSNIMGENYFSIKIITHDLYAKEGLKPSKTIWMSKNGKEYSEAFAGTGEARVVLLVNDLYHAPDKSLLLIDEPEISLHPIAINNLKKYILNLTLLKKHQVVITTHSPKFAEGLPEQAIKMVRQEENGIKIIENVDSREAFNRLGERSSPSNKKHLYVEDKLMCKVVEKVISMKGQNFIQESLKVLPSIGGATNMKHRVVTTSMHELNECFYLFDGDQYRPAETLNSDIIHPEWLSDDRTKVLESKIPESYNDKLGDIIKEMLGGVPVKFNVSSGNTSELHSSQRQFMNFWNNNVFFLEENTPEIALIKLEDYDSKSWDETSDPKGKLFFKKATEEYLGVEETNSESIFMMQLGALNKITTRDDLFSNIDKILGSIFSL